ncbi:MAG: hypothetical protein AB7D51_12400 [Desulfovibrionaceae bacterium]
MFFFLTFLAGLGGATALAGVGAIGAGLAADGLNYFLGDKEKEAGKDGLRSTKGAAKGVGMATAVNAGIAATAAVPGATAAVMPYATTAARSVGAAGGALLDKANKGYDAAKEYALRNPGWVAKGLEFADDMVNKSGPGNTLLGQGVNAYQIADEQSEHLAENRHEIEKEKGLS